MIISIKSSGDCGDEFEIEKKLQRAFATLRVAVVRTLGGGRFADGSAYIVLAHEADGPTALAALEAAGIAASELKPRAKVDNAA